MKRIGLVVAMANEQERLYHRLGKELSVDVFGGIKVTTFENDGCMLYLADSGIGEIHAALSTELLILKYDVDLIINFGLVGSLREEYKCKDVVLVKELVHYDFCPDMSDSEAYGKYVFQRDNYLFGIDNVSVDKVKEIIGECPTVRILTGDKFINVTDMHNWLRDHFGGDVCDMESMGIYFACRNFGVPCIMIKAVSDNADENSLESLDNIVEGGVTFYVKAVLKIIEAVASEKII